MRILIALLMCVLAIGCASENVAENHNVSSVEEPMPKKSLEIRYVPLGDSYTKGEGTTVEYSWPSVLAKHLQSDGINITLVANPAQNGWTTREVLEIELLAFEAAKPNFATLMIGANDFVQRMLEQTFRSNLGKIMDDMLLLLPSSDALIVITIPDFSVTPTGKAYEGDVNIEEGIEQFNEIIKEEAAKRNVIVVDLFEPSKIMETQPELLSEDGLHPSAQGYATWEEDIYPIAKKQISKLAKS